MKEIRPKASVSQAMHKKSSGFASIGLHYWKISPSSSFVPQKKKEQVTGNRNEISLAENLQQVIHLIPESGNMVTGKRN